MCSGARRGAVSLLLARGSSGRSSTSFGDDAPLAQREEAGAEIGPSAEQQHPDVVGNQVQAAVLDAHAPADPLVAGRAFERGGREGGQRRPVAVAEMSGVPDGLADLRPGAQIVVAVHQLVEAGLHLPRHRLNRQIGKVHGDP